MLQSLPPTTNFVVQYDDALANADKQAAALLSVVESEFVALTDIFDVHNAFGVGNRVTLQLNVPPGAGFGGLNHGYRSNGPMIVSFVVDQTSPDTVAAQNVKFIFVAEFVELLMSFNRQHGSVAWNPGYSDGEALSNFFAFERFPPLKPTSVISSWMHGTTRPDWVSLNDATDLNDVSYGCGLLFIYYLKSQLGYSVVDIVRKGGATLEDTYFNLTGRRDGFLAMTSLLDLYMPINNTLFKFTDGRNDLLPLLDDPMRLVFLSVLPSSTGLPRIIKRGKAKRRLLGCPLTSYNYAIVKTQGVATCHASNFGFGQPLYNWSVNGQGISGLGQIEHDLTVANPDPNAPLPSSIVQPVKIDFNVVDDGIESTLVLSFPATAGVIDLIVEVSAAELVREPSVSAATSAMTSLPTERVVWSADYFNDAKVCLQRFQKDLHALAPPFDWLSWDIAVILTLPDPAPLELLAALRLAGRLEDLRQRLRLHAPAAISEAVDAYLATLLPTGTGDAPSAASQHRPHA